MEHRITQNSVLSYGTTPMPVIGLGTWQATPEKIEEVLNAAIDIGYRHIDTAFAYMNEEAIGKTLKKMFDTGKVKREQLYIVTKLPHIAMRPELVDKYLKKSLDALQLDYVDLYLVHLPVGFVNRNDDFFPKDKDGQLELDMETNHVEIWKAMEKQVDAGRTKSIGVSNFNIKQIQRILNNCRIPPSNNQVELHIYLQQNELVEFCKKNKITVCAYAPLGSPHMADFNKIVGDSSVDTNKKPLSPLNDPVVTDIAKKHVKTPAQVLLRFLLQYGVAAIPKSSNLKRLKENFDVFDFELSKAEYNSIRALDRGKEGRIFFESNDLLMAMKRHPEYPWKDE